MGNDYVDCAHWLNELKIADLTQRRYKVITNMALKIVKHQKVREMLPLRKELRDLKRRHTEKYEGWKANTQRPKASAIPYMLKWLNKHDYEERKWCTMEE